MPKSKPSRRNRSNLARLEDREPAAALIAGNSLLAQLRVAEIKRLDAAARRVIVEKGEVIFREDDAADAVWLIVSGMVKLVRFARLEVRLALELRLSGDLLGAIFYREQPRHPCSAVALERTDLLRFPGTLLDELLSKNPTLTRTFLAEVCRQLCHAQQMRGLAHDDVPRRVGRALLYLHARFGPDIAQSRAILAELAGTTVESAIRVTRELARRGIISTSRGRIEIQSLGRLQKFASRMLPV